jgi:acyl-CoA thioesterase I
MKKYLNLYSLFLMLFALLSISFQLSAQDLKVACVGNSITEGAGTIPFPLQLDGMLGSGWDVQNFGIQGRTLLKHGDYPYWSDAKFTNAMNFLPDKVIIKLGTNDSKPQNWTYSNEFYADYLSLVDTFAQLSSNPEIFLCYPMKAFNHSWDIDDSIIFNGIIPLIDSVAKVRGLKTIDLHTFSEDKLKYYIDGIHPNTTGNNMIAEILFNNLVDSSMLIIHDNNVVFNQSVSTVNESYSTQNNLVDGNFANEWHTAGLPAAAIIDIGSEKKVDYLQLAFSTDMNRGYQYTVESSLNGADWDLLVDKSSRDDTVSAMSNDSIAATNLRYLRLTISSFSNSTDDAVKIAEFKAYKWTGYEHAPILSLKRISKTYASAWIKRDHPGDAISYYGASTDLTNFSIINFATSKSILINPNWAGTTGNTNSYFTVSYYSGMKVMSDTSTFTFYKTAPTAVDNIQANNEILAYPNPFTSEITFTNLPELTNEIFLKIYDVTGQLISEFSGENGQITWNGKDMNLNEAPAGIYICSIESGENAFSKKVIVCKR